MLKKFFSGVQKTVNTSAGGKYTEIYFSRYPQDKHECVGCSRVLSRSIPREVTIDHIVPQKAYGTNAITNLQVLCQPCNSRKKAKIDELILSYSGAALARELKRALGY